MPNYAALKTALATSPYAGETDAGIIAALNALTVVQPAYAPISAIASYLGSQGKLAGLIKWAASPPAGASPLSVVAAEELSFAFQNPGTIPGFDMAVPATAAGMQAFLAALVDPGLAVVGPIDEADQAAILGIASTMTSQAAIWGFSAGIAESDLIAARKMT